MLRYIFSLQCNRIIFLKRSIFHNEIASKNHQYLWLDRIRILKNNLACKPDLWFVYSVQNWQDTNKMKCCFLVTFIIIHWFLSRVQDAEVPREKPFCASSCFSIIICSFALCVPCNSLHCLNEAIFSTLFFFSPLLWTIRIFWRKLECENHLTPSNL